MQTTFGAYNWDDGTLSIGTSYGYDINYLTITGFPINDPTNLVADSYRQWSSTGYSWSWDTPRPGGHIFSVAAENDFGMYYQVSSGPNASTGYVSFIKAEVVPEPNSVLLSLALAGAMLLKRWKK